ncbi:MAG TPA: PAS domain S-box protein [Thermoleophilaceae bacterium]
MASPPSASVQRNGSDRSSAELLAELSPGLLATLDGEGRVLFANSTWRDVVGASGTIGYELTHPDDRGRVEQAIAGASPGNESCLECRLKTRDGSWRWVDWRVRHSEGRWYVAGQDVTERHEVTANQVKSEAQLAHAQRVVGVGSFEMETRSGRMSWSDELFRIFGLEPHSIELKRDPLLSFIHPEDQQRVDAMWSQALVDDGANMSVDFRIQRADGAERIVHARATIVDRDGRRIVGTLQDVTEHRRAQQALEASEKRYRALVEQVPAIVYTAGLGPEGSWDFVSPQVERMLGYSMLDWTENAALWLATIHPDDRDRVLRDESALAGAGDQLLSEYRMIARDGHVVHVRDEATVIEVDGGELKLQGVVLDVTQAKEAEDALRTSEEQYRLLVETSYDVIFALDADWTLTFMNEAAHRVFGYAPEEMIGHPINEFQDPERASHALEEAGKRLDGMPLFDHETTVLNKTGQAVDVIVNAAAIHAPDGAAGIVGTMRDITESKRAAAVIRAQQQQTQAIIDNSPMAIFAKDREHRYLLANREVEDLFGVERGALTGKLDSDVMPPEAVEVVRSHDAQVFESGAAVEAEEVIPKAGSDRTFMVHKFPLRDSEGEIYALCGIAADVTERKAREDALRAKVEWSFRIRQAIEHDRLTLFTQPIVDLATGETAQEELLLRMLGEDGEELIMPGEFLPPAERFGLAPAIDRWVVERAVGLARDRRIEVNLSGQSIGDEGLPEFIEAQLARTGADPSNLVFEITETAAAHDLVQARALADRLTALGCGFALDDFGTGYGSFTYLKHLPVSYLKIDMEFVRDIADDPSDRQVVKAIVDVARNFGIKTIAEGVESQVTLELLRGFGVDLVQGYHLGRPAPVETSGS